MPACQPQNKYRNSSKNGQFLLPLLKLLPREETLIPDQLLIKHSPITAETGESSFDLFYLHLTSSQSLLPLGIKENSQNEGREGRWGRHTDHFYLGWLFFLPSWNLPGNKAFFPPVGLENSKYAFGEIAQYLTWGAGNERQTQKDGQSRMMMREEKKLPRTILSGMSVYWIRWGFKRRSLVDEIENLLVNLQFMPGVIFHC